MGSSPHAMLGDSAGHLRRHDGRADPRAWPKGLATPCVRTEWRVERKARWFVALGASAVGALLLGLLLGRIASVQAASQPGHGSAILAFFPYEGAFDPARPAERVILRLDDYDAAEPIGGGRGRAVQLVGASGLGPPSGVAQERSRHRRRDRARAGGRSVQGRSRGLFLLPSRATSK